MKRRVGEDEIVDPVAQTGSAARTSDQTIGNYCYSATRKAVQANVFVAAGRSRRGAAIVARRFFAESRLI